MKAPSWLSFCSSAKISSNTTAAERDICRLKMNWLFVNLSVLVRSINLICVVPTNHQFIVNPTAQTLNITDEKIEPGLEQSEAFYSLTYTLLFLGHATGSVLVGLSYNFIPTWYLFLFSTLSYTLGYLLYALATSGWMMILARGLAGLHLGATTALAFSYYAVSFEKYTENLKTLGKFDEKKAKSTRGYLFSSYGIGNMIGFAVGLGFPLILAQFPNIPQFRTAGWFCMAVGLTLILLQLLLFHGECAWQCTRPSLDKLSQQLPSFRKEIKNWSEFFVKVIVPLYVILAGGLKGIRYVVNEVLVNPIATDSFGLSERDMTYFFIIYILGAFVGMILLYVVQCVKMTSFWLTVLGLICTITALLIMTDWQAIGGDPCTDYSLFHHPQLADQYRQQLAQSNMSESGMVSVQSLQVVEDEVYQMAVNRCESAGEHCHWIPNSLVTHRHCSDCQPICRSPQHTLNFIQFVIGISIFFSTQPLLYTGIFWLLSESVSKKYQGISAGSASALMGLSRSAFPQILDYAYEDAQKRTYLPMLIQVGIYLPLLVGFFLLYPWLGGSRKITFSQQTDDAENEEKTKLLARDSGVGNSQ